RGAHAGRQGGPAPRGGDGRRRRARRRSAGRGDLSRRTEAGDAPPADPVIPGELRLGEGEIELASGRERTRLRVLNTGDRLAQVGSHGHSRQTNPALAFDRAAARGFRLDVPAGTSVRFEPGAELDVTLVALAGARRVPGLRPEGGL